MDKNTVQEFEERAALLMDELKEHITSVQERNPQAARRDIYEAWVIQKIAAIQLVIEKFYSE